VEGVPVPALRSRRFMAFVWSAFEPKIDPANTAGCKGNKGEDGKVHGAQGDRAGFGPAVRA